MIVWGGVGSNASIFNTGGRYNPGTDSWTVTSTTNARGFTAITTYDQRGWVAAQTDDVGAQTSDQYDAAGNLIRVTDPRGAATN